MLCLVSAGPQTMTIFHKADEKIAEHEVDMVLKNVLRVCKTQLGVKKTFKLNKYSKNNKDRFHTITSSLYLAKLSVLMVIKDNTYGPSLRLATEDFFKRVRMVLSSGKILAHQVSIQVKFLSAGPKSTYFQT